VRSSGRFDNAARIVLSGMPTRCDTRMNATRRSVSRVYRRWFPEVRLLLIRPFDS